MKRFLVLLIVLLVFTFIYYCSKGIFDDIEKVNTYGQFDMNKPAVETDPPADGIINRSNRTYIFVKFSNDMDRNSVENAFSLKKISTNTKVSVLPQWEDDKKVYFYPQGLGLDFNEEYSISVTKSAKDVNTITMLSDYTAKFKVASEVDNINPSIIKTYPAKNQTNVNTNSSIQITFTEQMKRNSVVSAFRLMKDGVEVSCIPKIKGNVATFKPASKLSPEAIYSFRVENTAIADREGAQDTSANLLSQPYDATFVTAVSNATYENLKFVSITPENNAKNVELNPAITITFNNQLDDETLKVQLMKVGTNTPVPIKTSVFNNTVEVKPLDNLDSFSDYIIKIDKGLKDINVTSLSDDIARSFKTMELIIPTTTTVTTTTVTTTTTSTTTTSTTTTSTTTTGYYEALISITAAADSYTMGDGTWGCNCVESLSYNFNISKYEVTNAWFAQAMADGLYSNSTYWTTNGWIWKVGTANPSDKPYYWTDSNYNGTDQPVEGVSWYECVAFCNWLSAKKGYTKVYQSSGSISSLTTHGYRLPTDVEWEYCAAKGASGQSERIYAYGSILDCTKAVANISPCSVSKAANVGNIPSGNTPQGLCDMSGNVDEWCSDNYQVTPLSGSNRYYFVDDTTVQKFVYRGGSWNFSFESALRCSPRSGYEPYQRIGCQIGFRLVLP